ncbi:methyltransferase domain-containing protein [Nocardia terpenica]|uniref:methyltransferase domain-containing protein n=1 Tax=Nocardia terpenica TaxID=455432 RepID=UPI001EEAF598|nr:methyltransferase domain-containing protein [Nocardia terpenica]
MDDFYAALARGEAKPTGIMNYLQRLFIVERLRPGDRVVDVCCGRGLQLPVLYRYCPDLGSYTGLDIAAAHLAEARVRVQELEGVYPAVRWPIAFHEADVSQPWPRLEPVDVAVYTSALEHLPRDLAVASLEHTLAALTPCGVMYLSTPNTPGPPPRPLQHRVHVYEWSCEELRRGEALGLKWSDVDLSGRRLVIRQALHRVDGTLRLEEVKTEGSNATLPTSPPVGGDSSKSPEAPTGGTIRGR